MKENGFYKIKPEFIDLIIELGGKYADSKERPIFCCIEDAHIENLYWAIPTSDLSHHSKEQIEKIQRWCSETSIRSSYNHIGYTNRPAIYKISNCFPITEKYIDTAYISQGQPLVLKNKKEIGTIRTKLYRILFDESIHPNKYEQHITELQNFLVSEIQEQTRKPVASQNNLLGKTTERESTPFNYLLVELRNSAHASKPSKPSKPKDHEPER